MLRTSVVAGLAMVIALASQAKAEEPTSAQLIDALNAVFGQHPKTRASHAKGFCVKGSFTPAPAAAGLSKAPLFERAVPILGRFSMAGGNPKIADNTKSAPRGFAIRFGPEGNYTNLVMISAPVFFARTPAQMIEFLKVRVKAPGADAPDQTKIKAFSETHPETTRQGAWLANRPVPASYATVNYWAVHAYTLTNAQAETKTVKFKAVPAKGEVGLGDEEAKEKGENFYKAELEARLAGGPAAFDLLAIIGEPGDEMDDPTVMWEEDARPKVKLGTVLVEALEDDAVCDAMTFDPSTLPDGINGPERSYLCSTVGRLCCVGNPQSCRIACFDSARASVSFALLENNGNAICRQQCDLALDVDHRIGIKGEVVTCGSGLWRCKDKGGKGDTSRKDSNGRFHVIASLPSGPALSASELWARREGSLYSTRPHSHGPSATNKKTPRLSV